MAPTAAAAKDKCSYDPASWGTLQCPAKTRGGSEKAVLLWSERILDIPGSWVKKEPRVNCRTDGKEEFRFWKK